MEKIIENGFGYVSNGSVYFDTQAFRKSHNYRKLMPASETSEKEAAGLADGEGSLEPTRRDTTTTLRCGRQASEVNPNGIHLGETVVPDGT